jgi:hypothetical protein
MDGKSSIKTLALPTGIQELLGNEGFTPESISSSNPSEIAQDLGIDIHVARIISYEAKKALDRSFRLAI